MRRFEGRVALITGGEPRDRSGRSPSGSSPRAPRSSSPGASRSRSTPPSSGSTHRRGHAVGDRGQGRRRRAPRGGLRARSPSGSAASTTSSTTPASTPPTVPRSRSSASVVRKILEVNVVAALDWTRAAVAAGLSRSIVNIASIAGLSASPGIAFYGVSKAALINLTHAARGTSWPPASASTRSPPRSSRPASRRRSTRAARPRSPPATRSAASASPRRRRARSRSCSPTTPRGSPARRSRSTAAPVPSPSAERAAQNESTHDNLQRRRRRHAGRRRPVRHPGVREHLGAADRRGAPASPRARCTTTSSRRTTSSSPSTSGCCRCRRSTSTRSSAAAAPIAQTLHDVCVDVIETSIDFLPEGTVFFRSVHMLSRAAPEGGHPPPPRSTTTSSRALIERGQDEGLYRTDIPRAVLVAHFFSRRALPVALVLARGAGGQDARRRAADRPLPRRIRRRMPTA